MKRIARLIIFTLSASAFLVFVFTAGTACAEQPPNIVLIVSDDQSWTDYGFMEHEAIQTPNLDRLAKQSAIFRRGHVPTALCRPALATLITGLYSHQNLITGNDPAATPENRRHVTESGKDARELLISNVDKHPTIPRLLAEQGYLSFQCGKWWEGSYQRGGFTHGMTRGYPETGGRHGDDGLAIGREGMQPVNDFMDTAIDANKPFFIWYAPFLPHTPHNPPQRILQKYEQDGRPKSIAKYYAMCDWFDETCGQLLDQLDQKGIADNTLVIYVTDNGWIQNPDNAGYAVRSKRSPYEGGTRTPIMFRWPGRVPPADRPELCSSIDLVPTILAAAGAGIPQELPGLNLLPNLQNGTPIDRDTIFGESFAHDIADIENPEASLLYRWVIRDHSKLLLTYDGRPGKMVYPPADGGPQLFDLKTDPNEKVNLAADQPELVKELKGLLNDWYPVTQRNEGVVAVAEPLLLESSLATVGIDRSKGAAITWLSSTTYPNNMVNLSDPGRLIQQSYYAGKSRDRTDEGQSKSWSPWSWNPIQGGGVASWARVTAFQRTNDGQTLHSETVPKLWDMPNEEAAARMRQWTSFEADMPDVIEVKCEVECQRDTDDPWGPARMSPQETPACYFTRNFSVMKSYLGDGRWRDEKQQPGPPWGKTTPPRNSMAFFESGGHGVAVFSPTATRHWNFGPHGKALSDDPLAGPCMHVAPIDVVRLGPSSTYRYRYWLILGDAKSIASRLDTLWERYSTEKAELVETNPGTN